ncbi:MAG: class I adenylate cyclase [Planctomycetes bacterium]|nr:class I adenylate cyclase [Planctomycetota bacterium]
MRREETAKVDSDSVRKRRQAYNLFMLFKKNAILSDLTPDGRKVILAIPYILHSNKPKHLSIVEGVETPSGIFGYQADQKAVEAMNSLFAGEKFGSVSSSHHHAIEFLAVMGSVGTLAFGEASDLDFWVCLSPSVNSEQKGIIERKLRKIEEFALTEGKLECHFFTCDAKSLKRNDFGAVDAESAGSALGTLLKEEFYRSSTILAGKIPNWWVAPVGASEEEYAGTIETLKKSGAAHAKEYVDIGNVGQISKGEFFGGAVWQLYKGVKSPFKSVLKTALLMDYFEEGEGNLIACEQFKGLVFQNPTGLENLDAYAQLIRRVRDHAIKKHDSSLASLLEKCFLIKVGVESITFSDTKKLSSGEELIASMLRDWRWDFRSKEKMRFFKDWDFVTQETLGKQISAYLKTSLDDLQTKVEREKIPLTISTSDLKSLFNYLDAYYNSKPGKVPFLSPPFRKLAKSHAFTIRERVLYEGVCVYDLYRGNLEPEKIADSRSNLLRTSEDLMELAAFLIVNRLFTTSNHLRVIHPKANLIQRNIKKLQVELARFFETRKHLHPGDPVLLAPPVADRIVLLLNFLPPREDFEAAREGFNSASDPLNYGKSERSLVSSLTLLVENSWTEYFVQRFSEENQLSSACAHIVSELLENRKPNEEFFLVHAASFDYATPNVQSRLSKLLIDMASWFKKGSGRYFLTRFGGKSVLFRRAGKKVYPVVCDTLKECFGAIIERETDFMPIGIDCSAKGLQGYEELIPHVEEQTVNIFVEFEAFVDSSQDASKSLRSIVVVDERGFVFFEVVMKDELEQAIDNIFLAALNYFAQNRVTNLAVKVKYADQKDRQRGVTKTRDETRMVHKRVQAKTKKTTAVNVVKKDGELTVEVRTPSDKKSVRVDRTSIAGLVKKLKPGSTRRRPVIDAYQDAGKSHMSTSHYLWDKYLFEDSLLKAVSDSKSNASGVFEIVRPR